MLFGSKGKIWRQVVGLGLSMVAASAFLLSTVYFDFSPKPYAVEAPAEDWYQTIDHDK